MTGPTAPRANGGGLAAAASRIGGARSDWLDLSTGINPVPYPLSDIPASAWTQLPDHGAMDRLLSAARTFWNVPDGTAIAAAPGASALIARLPHLMPGDVHITEPTYNEWRAAFGPRVTNAPDAPIRIHVHPNNPDGRHLNADAITESTIIDESFVDEDPALSHIASGATIVKSFGKFWGLAGLRLGFLIGTPNLIEQFQHTLGPWPISGPALAVGTKALSDHTWAQNTRTSLLRDAARLDDLILSTGATLVGGTTLFRTYHIADGADRWQERLAQHHIWTRTFPYAPTWLRLGLPGTEPDWQRLEAAL